MKFRYLSSLCLLSLFIAGCAKDRVYGNMYEGLKKREQIVNPSNGSISQEQLSYDEYKREKEDSLKKDDDELLRR